MLTGFLRRTAHDPSPHAPSLSLLRVARKCHGPGRALAPLHLPSTPPSVLRDPHQMQMNLKYRVRAPSVFWHPLSLPAARLLKPSPVRRGLQPSQTGTVILALAGEILEACVLVMGAVAPGIENRSCP